MSQFNISVKMLMAGNGDAIVLSFIDEEQNIRNILVDGGNGKDIFVDHLQKVAEDIIANKQKIDLLVITHIDQDHIKGICYLATEIEAGKGSLNQESVEKYWFNSALDEKILKRAPGLFDVSAKEMRDLEKFLHHLPDEKWDIKDLIYAPCVRQMHGAALTILSPIRELLNAFIVKYQNYDVGSTSHDYDRSLKELYAIEKKQVDDGKEELDDKLENATSIAFLIEQGGTSLLYLGDAIPAVIDPAIEQLIADRGLERLEVNAVKLSHHASRKSISAKFLKLVKSTKYLISANGKKANLPNKATFAKILLNEHRDLADHIEFYFNYPGFSSVLKFTEEEFKELNFSCHDANFEHGYLLTL